MGVLGSPSRLFRFGCALLVFVGLIFNNGLFWDITSRRPASVQWTYRGQGKTAADAPQVQPSTGQQVRGAKIEHVSAGTRKDGGVPTGRAAPQTEDGRLGPAGAVNH